MVKTVAAGLCLIALLPPRASGQKGTGGTTFLMERVDFRADSHVDYRIKSLRGVLARADKGIPASFDDKRSFILRIQSGSAGLSVQALSYMMNSYAFSYEHAPLKDVKVSTAGSKLEMKGKATNFLNSSFDLLGDLSASSDGKIRLHPTSIKIGGVPVKGVLKLFGVELGRLMKTRESRGVRIDKDNIILDPELVVPPPAIRGKVSSAKVEDGQVVLTFGNPGKGSATKRRPSNGAGFMAFKGGTLRFGKLTMRDSDLTIAGQSSKGLFDFSIDHYNEQLVAGFSKSRPNYGLIAYVPNFSKLSQLSASSKRSPR